MKEQFSKHSFDKIDAYNNIELHYRTIYPEFSVLINRSKFGSILYCIGEAYRNGKQNELRQELDWAISIAKGIKTSLPLKGKTFLN